MRSVVCCCSATIWGVLAHSSATGGDCLLRMDIAQFEVAHAGDCAACVGSRLKRTPGAADFSKATSTTCLIGLGKRTDVQACRNKAIRRLILPNRVLPLSIRGATAPKQRCIHPVLPRVSFMTANSKLLTGCAGPRKKPVQRAGTSAPGGLMMESPVRAAAMATIGSMGSNRRVNTRGTPRPSGAFLITASSFHST
jgi:hypothetical protein